MIYFELPTYLLGLNRLQLKLQRIIAFSQRCMGTFQLCATSSFVISSSIVINIVVMNIIIMIINIINDDPPHRHSPHLLKVASEAVVLRLELAD